MATTKSKPMPALCCLTIDGYVEILLPADAGLKVLALMRGALRTRRRFDGEGHIYELGEELQVDYSAVKSGQVRHKKPDPAPAAPRAIGHEPLKLPYV